MTELGLDKGDLVFSSNEPGTQPLVTEVTRPAPPPSPEPSVADEEQADTTADTSPALAGPSFRQSITEDDLEEGNDGVDDPSVKKELPEKMKKHLSGPCPQGGKGLAAGLVNAAKARWGRVKRAFQGLFKAKNLALEDKREFLTAAEETKQSLESGSMAIKLELEDAKALRATSYTAQGDMAFYTEDALQQRHRLRNSPELKAAITRWWQWLPRVYHDPATDSNSVSKPVYCAMVVMLQLVLLPMHGMKGDKDYSPYEDWDHDSKGLPAVDFPNLFDSLFELADMWCDSIDAADYAALLDKLLDKMMAKTALWHKLLKKFGFEWPKQPKEPKAKPPPPEPKPLPPPPPPKPPPPAPVPPPAQPPPPKPAEPPPPPPPKPKKRPPSAAPRPNYDNVQSKLDMTPPPAPLPRDRPATTAPPARQPTERQPLYSPPPVRPKRKPGSSQKKPQRGPAITALLEQPRISSNQVPDNRPRSAVQRPNRLGDIRLHLDEAASTSGGRRPTHIDGLLARSPNGSPPGSPIQGWGRSPEGTPLGSPTNPSSPQRPRTRTPSPTRPAGQVRRPMSAALYNPLAAAWQALEAPEKLVTQQLQMCSDLLGAGMSGAWGLPLEALQPPVASAVSPASWRALPSFSLPQPIDASPTCGPDPAASPPGGANSPKTRPGSAAARLLHPRSSASAGASATRTPRLPDATASPLSSWDGEPSLPHTPPAVTRIPTQVSELDLQQVDLSSGLQSGQMLSPSTPQQRAMRTSLSSLGPWATSPSTTPPDSELPAGGDENATAQGGRPPRAQSAKGPRRRPWSADPIGLQRKPILAACGTFASRPNTAANRGCTPRAAAQRKLEELAAGAPPPPYVVVQAPSRGMQGGQPPGSFMRHGMQSRQATVGAGAAKGGVEGGAAGAAQLQRPKSGSWAEASTFAPPPLPGWDGRPQSRQEYLRDFWKDFSQYVDHKRRAGAQVAQQPAGGVQAALTARLKLELGVQMRS